jgi:phospholipid/cholesterol/gamma-HCH transport system substrate-binding protein
MADISEGVPRILRDVESITATIDDATARLDGILSSQNVDRIDRIVGNVDSTAAQFDALVAEVRETRRQLDAVMTRINRLMDEETGEISIALADLRHSLAAVARHADAIASNLEGTTRNLNEVSRQVRDNPGVLIRGRNTEAETP